MSLDKYINITARDVYNLLADKVVVGDGFFDSLYCSSMNKAESRGDCGSFTTEDNVW